MTLAFLVLVKLWLVAGQSLTASAGSSWDDELFLSIASSFANGEWLGAYDERTLAKGPFYPIFVGLNAWLGLPLSLTQHLVYSGGCLLVALALRPLRLTSAAVLLMFTVLLFNPVTFSSNVLRVTREGIYVPLTLVLLGCSTGILLRWDRPPRELLKWSVGLGFSFAAFWMTREEGLWILPLLVSSFVPLLMRLRRERDRVWRRLGVILLLPISVAAAALLVVASLNALYYETFSIVEVKQRDFVDAYAALTRLKHGKQYPRIPFPREVWPKLARVSPAFGELFPHLEEARTRWAEWQGEITGAGFLWVFREAAASAGHHRSGATARAFYRRLADEVNAACGARELDCLPERSSLMPRWRFDQLRPLLLTIRDAARHLVTFGGLKTTPDPSAGSAWTLIRYQDVTWDRSSPREGETELLRVGGWIFDETRRVRLSVRRSDGTPTGAQFEMDSPSIDVCQHFLRATGGRLYRNACQARFSIATACTQGCSLEVASGEDVLGLLPLESIEGCGNDATLHWCIDYRSTSGGAGPFQERLDATRLAVLAGIGRIYQLAMPTLAGLALLAFAISLGRWFRRRSPTTDLLWVELALLSAIGVRLVLLSLIHVMAFAGISINYLSPAHPLLLAAITIPWLQLTQPSGSREPQP